MSQHYLRVDTATGHSLNLMAGWDWPLRQFYLTLCDSRDPDNEIFDSQATMEGIQGWRSIADVEQALTKFKIPFGDIDGNPEQQNPKLLPLLCELLNEKDSPRPALDQKQKFWNKEPDPEPKAPPTPEALEYEREYMKRYTEEEPNPLYTVAMWEAAKPQLRAENVNNNGEWFATHYQNWVRMQINHAYARHLAGTVGLD